MYKISKDIYDSIENKGIIIEEIEFEKRCRIMDSIKERYVDYNKKGEWLWDKLDNYESICDSNGWRYIIDYILNNECILFFNQDEEKTMFLIKSGSELNYILSETSGFEFYVTNVDCSYLICFNHHDILYGCGKASEWVKGLKSNLL